MAEEILTHSTSPQFPLFLLQDITFLWGNLKSQKGKNEFLTRRQCICVTSLPLKKITNSRIITLSSKEITEKKNFSKEKLF